MSKRKQQKWGMLHDTLLKNMVDSGGSLKNMARALGYPEEYVHRKIKSLGLVQTINRDPLADTAKPPLPQ